MKIYLLDRAAKSYYFTEIRDCDIMLEYVNHNNLFWFWTKSGYHKAHITYEHLWKLLKENIS